MTSGQIAALVLTLLVVAAVAAFGVQLRRQDHPEDTASHHPPAGTDERGPTHPYPRGGRPAGPGAEGMAVAEPGDIVPGSPTARAAERAEPGAER